jgi:hypothetical protein
LCDFDALSKGHWPGAKKGKTHPVSSALQANDKEGRGGCYVRYKGKVWEIETVVVPAMQNELRCEGFDLTIRRGPREDREIENISHYEVSCQSITNEEWEDFCAECDRLGDGDPYMSQRMSANNVKMERRYRLLCQLMHQNKTAVEMQRTKQKLNSDDILRPACLNPPRPGRPSSGSHTHTTVSLNDYRAKQLKQQSVTALITDDMVEQSKRGTRLPPSPFGAFEVKKSKPTEAEIIADRISISNKSPLLRQRKAWQ